MRALILNGYGGPEQLSIAELPQPEPAPGQVRIRVAAASLNSWDDELLRGTFANRMLFGLRRPRIRVLGADVAGTVDAVGDGVTRWRPGDRVFGDLSVADWGGFAEAVCAPEAVLAALPEGISFREAAALPQAGLLALQGLRLAGGLAGSRPKGSGDDPKEVLVNGAGGGVGSFAIQLAKQAGATVTAVDTAAKFDAMRAAGADRVLDFTRKDFAAERSRYDITFDVLGKRSIFAHRRALRPGGKGVYAGGSPGTLLEVVLLGGLLRLAGRAAGRRTIRLVMLKPSPEDLWQLAERVATGEIYCQIGGVYSLEETARAFRDYESGSTTGKLVIAVDPPPAQGQPADEPRPTKP